MKSTLSDVAKRHYNAYRNIKKGAIPLCKAPANALYFGLRGRVYSCCFNKQHLLGTYPRHSLKEIWHSNARTVLEEALSRDDFKHGCMGCLDLIEVENYKALPAKNYDDLPIAQYPTKLDFELSNECNLECIMCRGEFSSAIRKNREKLPPILSPYDHSFLTQLKEFVPHVKHAHFLGGEPFMISIYHDIWEMFSALNPQARLSIQTNATIISRRVKDILEKGRFEIAISIDSINKATYEQIRKNGKFERVIENINYLIDYCKRKNTNISISYCPMTCNVSEIPDVINWCNDKNLPLFFNTVTYPSDLSLRSLSSHDLKAYCDNWTSIRFPSKNPVHDSNISAFKGLINHLEQWLKEKDNTDERPKNYEQFKDGLKRYIELNNYANESNNLFDLIMQKIEFIINSDKSNYTKKERVQALLKINFKDICTNVPKMDESTLMQLFETFAI